MADSGVACVTLIDIPLERSLYVGNMLAGILYGESSSSLCKTLKGEKTDHFDRHLTHETRRQDWTFSHSSPLRIASPIVPRALITAKAKPSTSSLAGSCSHSPPSTWPL